MSKVYELLKEQDCCLNRRVSLDFCKKLDNILEENKNNINFVFGKYTYDDYKKYGNKYANFIIKYYDCRLCLGCAWHVTTKYNDTPIGEIIYCYN